MFKQSTALFILGCSLMGCDQKEPTRDVQYYTDHVDERKKKIAECQNNPGELENTANCRNAMESISKAILNSNNTGMPKIVVPKI